MKVKKAGRPKTPKEEKKVTLSISIHPMAVDVLTKRAGHNKSKYLEDLILKESGEIK